MLVLDSVCSSRTQRILPAATSLASQDTLTSLSRPEKPPMPATFALLRMIAEAALDWLETAIGAAAKACVKATSSQEAGTLYDCSGRARELSAAGA